ncbi:uncharacterized protein BDW43DRAFT_307398 [Aspergillus alliaceus]|uniref:uncharacterized protein n=1 Tax=Petromyces alliaceus TaxID=209559 RepID=UPI0012A4B118|nr:uncharacterized protein BDW43DRAFT_307398 [Aspergillus alliaceus]KAB8237114.1 hypothetical protein BDW43DRAFT_307398 [Aspergillus alliaceus]
MVLPISRGVYFTLQPTGTILSATFENGKIASQETFPDGRYPQNWVDTLREMEATLGCTKDLDLQCDIFGNQSSIQESTDCPSGLLSPSATSALTESYIGNLEVPSPQAWPQPCLQMQEQDNMHWSSTMRASPMPGAYSTVCPCTATHTHELPGELEYNCSHAPSVQKRPNWSSKRMTKLQNLLSAIRNHSVPTMEEHNGQVDGLYNGSYIPVSLPGMPIMQFAGVLSRLGSVSNTLGFVYGMLSWEIFMREEERLIREEHISVVLAAKQVNRKMAELLKHPGKAKDWASDGRKAAKIVFGTLEGCSNAVKSFALFLLGNVCSLDSMLKIAHFPIIRKNFQMSFAQIVAERTPQWEALEAQGYKIFDYAEFLRHRGPPVSIGARNDHLLSLNFECMTPNSAGLVTDSASTNGSVSHGSDFGSSSVSEVDLHVPMPTVHSVEWQYS